MKFKWIESGERIIRKAGFATIATPYSMYFRGIANIYLTDRRLYGDIMLIHIKLKDIPLASIKRIEAKSFGTGGFKSPLITYRKNGKEEQAIFFVNENMKEWLSDICNLAGKNGAYIDESIQEVNSASLYKTGTTVGLAAAVIIFCLLASGFIFGQVSSFASTTAIIILILFSFLAAIFLIKQKSK